MKLILPLLLLVLSLSAQQEQPNVIFILADDLGINALNCYGNKHVESPHIDQLFAEGMHFTNGYSSDPTCAPSRASIVTGQYVPRHGVYRVADRYKKKKNDLANMHFLPPEMHRPDGRKVGIDPDKITVAEALQSADYATAAFGKCHFGSQELSFGAHGFDEAIETTKHYNFKAYPAQDDIAENEYNATYTTRKGIDFMRRKTAEKKPFFLYMPYYLVHKPLEPEPHHLAHFNAIHGDTLNTEVIQILAMIKGLDERVGELVAAVKELNIEKETIIIFTSDNGHYKTADNFFNQPYREYKGSTLEGGIRVPYVFKWKGKIEEGSKSTEPIIHVDLYPTILALTNTEQAKDYPLDGEDISPILLGKKEETKERELVWQYTNYSGYNLKRKDWRSSWVNVIQADGYKMTEDVEKGTYFLYDLNNDPYEMTEIAEKMPEKVKELRVKLEDWKVKTGSETPRLNPDFSGE